MRENTSTRLKQIMREQNLKQIDILNKSLPFQKKLGIKMGKSALSQYVSGKSNPDQQKLVLLAKTLGVSEPWLMGFDVEKKKSSLLSLITEASSQLTTPRQQKVYDFAKNELIEQEFCACHEKIQSLDAYKEMKDEEELAEIDWYGSVSAGTGQFIFSNSEKITLPKKKVPIIADFCLSVSGDSMEPLIHDGDYVFVAKQETIYSGTIGVVTLDGEAFIKRVIFENDIARLKSFNKKYKDIIVNHFNDFRIIGKVVL
ncbi:S24 family peptidase [Enterococcus hirae]|uniref:S24 family peptidase n=1 Tax=Enterococcus hirae TaxID=1354 RepID=UPI0013781BBF|nr:S24 family peptidase [Enterococcus hirae]NBA57038.1 helix-turn-helix domain-containing protein [Enterococcus hirae]